MTTPRQPEQVDLDLTTAEDPREGRPSQRADVNLRRIRIGVKLGRDGLEGSFEEDGVNAWTSAVMQIMIMILLAGGMTVLIWAISRNVAIALTVGGVVMTIALVYVWSTRRREHTPSDTDQGQTSPQP